MLPRVIDCVLLITKEDQPKRLFRTTSHINIPMAGRCAATSENENRVADGHEIASVMVARPRTLI